MGDPSLFRRPALPFGDALLQDVVDVRVWLGFHFRTADTASRDLGEQLAAWTLDHYFQPVHGEG